jgi:uncharacterized membrane protein
MPRSKSNSDIPPDPPSSEAATDALSATLERNISALVRRRMQDAQNAGVQDRIADVITRFAGSMVFVYLHLVLFGGWIVINLGWLPIPPWDRSMVILAMVASVEAIFISTFVLISQNRMAAADDKRADLNLQISLLAEHETTKLIAMVSAIAERLEVTTAMDDEIRDLKQDVEPETLLDQIERNQPRPKR